MKKEVANEIMSDIRAIKADLKYHIKRCDLADKRTDLLEAQVKENSEFVVLLARIFNLFAGLIYIITAILIFAHINLSTQNTLLFIAIIIIFISISRLLNGIFNKNLQKYLRITRLITGSSIFLLAIFSMIRNSVESTSIILLAIALLINSVQKSLIGVFTSISLF